MEGIWGIDIYIREKFPAQYPGLVEEVHRRGFDDSWQGLVLSLMNPDPEKRPTALEALTHPWLTRGLRAEAPESEEGAAPFISPARRNPPPLTGL